MNSIRVKPCSFNENHVKPELLAQEFKKLFEIHQSPAHVILPCHVQLMSVGAHCPPQKLR